MSSAKRHTTVCDPSLYRSFAFSNYPLLYTIYVESCLTTLMGRSHGVLENAKPIPMRPPEPSPVVIRLDTKTSFWLILAGQKI